MPENPNKDYWRSRAEATIIGGEVSALQYERQLKKAYESTKRQIEKEIQAFYSKYATDNKISLAEARRRLKPDEQKDFNAQAKMYLDEIAKMGRTPMTKEYMSHLKQLSGKAYISRLDELSNNIRYNIEKLYAGQSASLGKALNEGYEDSYYRTMFNVQDQAKIEISFTTPGKRTVEAASKEKWLGQNYSDRIWTNKNKLIKQLEQILPQEFVRSKGPASVARTLSQKLDVSYNNAKRLARTEMNYISNKATMQAYIDSGIGEYEYVATLDARTSDICRELDGKIFPIKEATPGINWPPLHPNCRSTTIPYFEDDDIGKVADDRIARAKDGKGKSVKLGQDVSFFEWVEEYGSPEFKERVKAQRYKFLNAGMTREQMKAYNKLAIEEPVISKKMKEIAKNTDQTLKGYKFRLKTEQSYSRKVESTMLENNISEEQAIKDMNDVIRYTLVSSPKDLVKNFYKTKKLFDADSYKLLRVKNSWTNENMAYKGVNCVFQSPNGEKFEVQFHTPESFSVKQNELHKMYEEQRLLTTSAARRAELENMMLEISKTLEVPKDIEEIGK